tara:strand:- start:32 stop:169 length:138 start_codon:yes stop_codon:yes gene_type:complete
MHETIKPKKLTIIPVITEIHIELKNALIKLELIIIFEKLVFINSK